MIRSLVLLCILAVCAVASAQDEIQQIRQQITQLQQMLDSMESAPAPKRNVTQIGAAQRNRKVETGMIVRIYDLGDLFAVAPPYPAMMHSDLNPQSRSPLFDSTSFSGMGGMGGGGFFSISPTRATATSLNVATTISAAATSQAGTVGNVKSSQDEMITVIRETIKPEIWKDGGKITKLGNAFVISADEEAHDQIETLLNLFRTRWGTLRTVSVRAWWLSLAPSDVRGLLDAPTENLAEEGPPVFGIVSDERWQELLQIWEQPDENDVHRLRYQAAVTCYNGQTVSQVSGLQDLAVSNFETVVSENDNGQKQGKIGYSAVVTTIQEGLAFQVTPVTNVSGKTVLLDIHSRLFLPAASDAQVAKKRQGETVFPEDVASPIDRRRLNIHRLSTTARVPVDRPYLVGGMSLPAADTEGLNLYLFVKLSVQELRNDQESAGKGIEEPAQGHEKPPGAKNE